jgi:hypothetical protein
MGNKRITKRKMDITRRTSKIPICSMGGTLLEHNISSMFQCIYRCHKALDQVNMVDFSNQKCNWSRELKSPEDVRKEWNK